MARPFDRCIVTISLDGSTFEPRQFFVYGRTAEELNDVENLDEVLNKLLPSRFPDHGNFTIKVHEADHDLPINRIPHVYTQGRKAPEFV